MRRGAAAGLAIVAPASRPSEVRSLHEAGASELYCGYLPEAWAAAYGSFDSLNRRQGGAANLSDPGELRETAAEARACGMPAALALNTAYTAEQLPEAMGVASAWREAGGSALLVSDPALLLRLRGAGSGLDLHLSILAEAFNSATVEFFRQFGISRVVLPRSLGPSEMAELIRGCREDLEFEAMALNDACAFIDGLCGFYHGRAFPPGVSSDFRYERDAASGRAVTYAQDLRYEGHGCALAFETPRGAAAPRVEDDRSAPHCAACSLAALRDAGVGFLKIGGRGLTPELKLRSVAFLAAAIGVLDEDSPGMAAEGRMRALFESVFALRCSERLCYYPRRAEDGLAK